MDKRQRLNVDWFMRGAMVGAMLTIAVFMALPLFG